jgi:tetratricopeptide (TPR) repeat protein
MADEDDQSARDELDALLDQIEAMEDDPEADLRGLLRRHEEQDPAGRETAVAHHDLGQYLLEQGDFADAETHLRQAHTGFARHFGAQHVFTLSCLVNLGVVVRAQGRLAEALDMFTAVADVRLNQFGPENPLTQNALALVADLQAQLGPPDHPRRRGWARRKGRP